MLDRRTAILDRGTVVAGYYLEERLGGGGMGTVFRARHVDSGRIVALKLMAGRLGPDPDHLARFRSEGRAQAALEHPHVVTVYEAGDSEHGLYLAMRLVDGPPLVDLLRDHGLEARRALGLLTQVADALDAAHAVGLVHRDVKPHNVLVGPGDHAYLADFGLTRADAEPALTATGTIVGTVAYLAPEVVRGQPATAASDRYAFAAMAFECLAGGVVFSRTTDAAVLFAHASDPPPRIGARRPELGPALDSLFERALAKDPAERPATARALVDAIARTLERTGGIALPPPPPPGAGALALNATTTDTGLLPVAAPDTRPRSRRRVVALAALAALGGGAVVAAAWLAFGREDGSRAATTVAVDRPGLRYLGSPLTGPPGRPLDCLGRSPEPTSPSCTVVQAALPGAMVVVPTSGVIRHWQVRGAQGELTLVVLRPRDGGSFQVTMSSTERVGSADVQGFDTDLAVDRGDLVGLRLVPGSAVGVRDGAAGATTERWLPPVTGFGRAADRPAGSGFNHELLLRVGLLPGGRVRRPQQLTGSAAERVPSGRVLRRRSVRLAAGTLQLALVDTGGGAFALDEFVGRRRVARIAVPGLTAGATITRFVAATWAPDLAGLDLHYVGVDSAHVIQRGYAVTTSGFQLIR